VDWKPERAVQAKVRDSQQKKNDWWGSSTGEHFASVCKWRLLPDFRSTMGYLPRGISCYLVPNFTLSMAQFVHDNTIFKEVCRVFVLQCRSTFYLTSLVSPHRVHLSHTIYVQSYKLDSYINTLICSYIHTFMCTKHIHNIILHMVALVTQSLGRLHHSVSILTYHVSSGQS